MSKHRREGPGWTGRTTEADRLKAIYSPDWLTPAECAELSGVSAKTIRAACRAGEMTYSDKSHPDSNRPRYLIRREWWEAWERGRTHEAEEPAA